MTLVKKLLDWNEEMRSEIDVTKDKHPYLKAFGSGAIEGYVNSATLLFPIALALGYYWKHQALKK